MTQERTGNMNYKDNVLIAGAQKQFFSQFAGEWGLQLIIQTNSVFGKNWQSWPIKTKKTK